MDTAYTTLAAKKLKSTSTDEQCCVFNKFLKHHFQDCLDAKTKLCQAPVAVESNECVTEILSEDVNKLAKCPVETDFRANTDTL